MKRDRKYYQRIGRKGGLATVAKYGRRHMSKIGKKGFQTTTCRYFLGNDQLHKRYLIRMGLHVYWRQSGLPMKYGPDGKPIWPEEFPTHPAWEVAPGQPSLFEKHHIKVWEELPW